MIVVADTSPLNYLLLIRSVEVLEPLYSRVLVPRTVATELTDPTAPAAVRAWISPPPVWLDILPDPPSDLTLEYLDPGERAAITLAKILDAARLLIDDQAGRAEAERLHLPVTGTLGVLADAHLSGLLDFNRAIVLLCATNFRISAELERLVRRRISTVTKR